MNELDHLTRHDGFYVLHLFAGAGGGILADIIEGNTVVCAVEWEAYPAAVLCARQNDGVLSPYPVWSDVRTFRSDNPECHGMFDALRSIADRLVIAGGFPCQDISVAGRGDGLEGERSGLWKEFRRIVGEIRPRQVRVENSPALTTRGGKRVIGDLAGLGYVGRNGIVSAADAAAPHERKRFWIVANTRHFCGWNIRPSEGRIGQPGERTADSGAIGRPGEQSEVVADSGGGWGPDDELRARRDVAGIRGEDLADAQGERRREAGELRHDESEERSSGSSQEKLADAHSLGRQQGSGSIPEGQPWFGKSGFGSWWSFDPADLPDAQGEGLETAGRKPQLTRLGKFRPVSNAYSFGRDGWTRELGTSGRSEPSSEGSVSNPDSEPMGRPTESWGERGGGPIEPRMGSMASGLADRLGQPRCAAGGKLDRVAKGISARVPRLKALGNGQVPAAAVKAWRHLS